MPVEENGIIHFKGVTKIFGSLVALSDISFDVKKVNLFLLPVLRVPERLRF